MKNLMIINSLIFSMLLSSMAYGGCDFSKGINPGPNNTFIYTEACHKQVGVLVQQNQVQTKQLTDLNKAITLKDLALQEADKRADKWNSTASNLEDRLQKVDSLEKKNDWLYFGLGVVTTFLAGYGMAKLVR